MKVILTVIFAIALIFTVSITNITAEEEVEGFVRSVDFSLKKRKLRDTSAEITFYEDDQLENAACYGRDGLPDYNAQPSDRIGAMSMSGLEMCYECLQITNPKNKKKVVVKIIDMCAGCPRGNVDLTLSSFASIADPIDGIVKITWKPVGCPSKGRFPTFEKKRNKKRNI